MIGSFLKVARMKRNQWKSREELEEMQEKKLCDLISYACKHVPHYKKHLKKIGGLDELSSLPLITKKHLRDPGPFISNQYKKESLLAGKTSGSTGMPLTTYSNQRERAYGLALYRSRFIEAGFGPLDLMARVVYRTSDNVFGGARGFFRTRFLSLFDDEEKNLLTLASMRPDVIRSYPSVLALLAHKNLDAAIGLNVRKAISTAEILSKETRKLVTRSFNCDLRNIYGAIETGPIAWECEKGSMHVHSDSIIIEAVDSNGNPLKEGKCGDVVLTPLWMRSMPLIRYNLGDKVKLGSKCRCGRGSHVITDIKGRSGEFLTMHSGRICHSLSLDIYIRTFPNILLFKAFQERPGHLYIKIVPKGRLSKETQNQIVKKLQGCFPEPMDIEIELVNKIERDRTGKISAVVSKVKPRF